MPTVDPFIFVVMGGRGDLMARKLLPALYHLSRQGFIDERCVILGVARRGGIDDETYRAWAREALEKAGIDGSTDSGHWCDGCLYYHSIGGESAGDFAALRSRISDIESRHGLGKNRAFYLALPPQAFPSTICQLGTAGLNTSGGWTRIVVEKPFGHDLESARALNDLLHQWFDEKQVYRIDHYLGKETVQNLLVFRFANSIFESLWNRDRIDNIQITVGEEIGIEGRAGYYEQAGALRDMVQNHLAQLLALTAMEVPAAFEADAIRYEKAKVLRSIAPIDLENVVMGQYGKGEIDGKPVGAYKDADGVAGNSRTETYAALKLEVANWRWQGVPFYLRTGKRLPRRATQIIITFRSPPVALFHPFQSLTVRSNVLVITLQPNEGFDLGFEVKAPGEPISLQTQKLDFRYEEAFEPLPDAYETLLLDIMTGDQTLFVRSDEVESSWQLFTPLLDKQLPISNYTAGSWGPEDADALLNREGRRWRNL
ncbi:MAG: glucose-6-phosphate dehydrogenase [Candidatus Krumholzibacteriia bacterium]